MFRFENMEIWQEAILLSNDLFDVADEIESKKLYRFAEQLRGAALSISNNIAEGSGSFSDKEFGYFLNVARRSTFECANLMFVFHLRKLITEERKLHYLERLEILAKKITNFRKALNL
ncbi:MAG TPA: four helix bundle protein [Bacteroidales bacterium]|mgnify:CR=1 FL=1|nr:four helix bundle protein [Bacteroidales bacterium]